MGNGPGVTVEPWQGKRWRIRWREWVIENGERRRVQRSRVVSTEAAAIELRAKVLRTIEVGEVWQDAVLEIPTVASFDAATAAWLRHKAARGVAASSVKKYGTLIAAWFLAARKVLKLAPEQPVPVSALNRSLFAEVALRWRRLNLGESTIYNGTRVALDAWTWTADDPAAWPGTPPAPRDKTTILPQAPIYTAPPAPTLAEIDACVARLTTHAYVAKGAAIVMRYTGLRISQVFALQRDDLDVTNLTLTVRTGKGRREASTHRVVPIARSMLTELSPYLGPEGGPLLRRRRDLRSAPTRSHNPTKALTDAWEAATKAGKVRRDVWKPSTRRLARPDHAFRAAFQQHLVEHGVRDEVVDVLVGHAGTTTRARHYVSPEALAKAMREAIDTIPAIDWSRGDEEVTANVVQMRW